MTHNQHGAGSCLCGAVCYESAGPWRPSVACHCTQCRKTTGHYLAATSVPKNSLNVTGQVTVYQSSQTARRGFCTICGSSLLGGHLYYAGKGTYYDIHDPLSPTEQNGPVLTTKVDA